MVEEESNAEELPGWVPLFTSLMILLCAFFILLVAYASFDTKKTKEAIGSLRGTFGVAGGGVPGLLSDGAGISLTSKPMKKDEAAQKRLSIKKLKAIIKFQDSQKGIRVQSDSEGLRIDAAERVMFDTGSFDLKPASEEFLTLVADLMKSAGVRAVVEGHCDSEDIGAMTCDSGWELSLLRSLAVTSLLIAKDVEPARISSQGYGQYHPLSKQTSAEGGFNRRVTILLKFPDKDKPLLKEATRDGEEEKSI
ncbi:OmpA family protein [bacterium]|nr:OmpA family protein [bacterium]